MSGKKKMLLALMCLLLLCTLCSAAMAYQEDVFYIYYEPDSSHNLTRKEDTVTATVLTGDEETLSTGWYVADGVSFYYRLVVSGDVRLILKDGCSLTASQGITVEGSNTLSIYAQSEGDNMGALNVPDQEDYAGIGGRRGNSSGLITIHGGKIVVTVNGDDAAIGGGYEGSGTVTIYGGKVIATTNGGGAAIGGGKYGSAAVTINGGKITAKKGTSGSGAGIGDGFEGSGSTISLGWTNADDFIESDSYSGEVTLEKVFQYEDNGVPKYAVGEISDNGALGGKKLEPPVSIPEYTVTVIANPTDGGTVTGGGTYKMGTKVTVTATPNQGYRFVNWTEGEEEVSKDAAYTFMVLENHTLTATFIPVYTVAVAAAPEAAGTVTGGGIYDKETEVTVTATASEGYHFVNWTEGGEVVGTEPELRIIVTADRNLTANFELYSVTVAADPPEGGKVTGGGLYASGASATIAATPNQGYRFMNWTENGQEISKELSLTFPATADRVLTANFEELPPFDKEHVNFVIPAGSIGANAFAGDEAIAIVDASLCTSIGVYAFRDCKGLTQILLPADCVFPSSAFEGCEALVAIYAPGAGTTQKWAEEAGIPFMPVE